MRLWKKTLSVGLSLALCAGMVAPAFAASFTELNTAITTGKSVYQEDGTTYKIEASKDDTGAVNVKLHEEVEFDTENKNENKSIKILKGQNVTIDLNGYDIDGQGKSNSVISIEKGGELTLTDSTAEWVEDEDGSKTLESGAITGGYYSSGGGVYNNGTFTMENCVIKDNIASAYGGGVYNNGTFNMENAVIKDNRGKASGGGVCNSNSSTSTFNMENSVIKDNSAGANGGGVYVYNGTFNMTDGVIEGNTVGASGGGVYVNKGKFSMTSGDIEGNKGDIYCKNPADMLDLPDDSLWDSKKDNKIYSGEDLESVTKATSLKHHEHTGEWETTTPAQPGVEGEETRLCPDCGRTETRPIDALPDLLPVASTPTTEIDDVEVPLAAGPVTRAEFIDYLWRHEGKPASNGVCTFADVPADHEYVLALAWAERNGIAAADEDGNFQPDELVTVGAVREFLGNFARVFGMDVNVYALTTLTGEDDEAVLNCDEVLAEFFGEEPAEQAA